MPRYIAIDYDPFQQDRIRPELEKRQPAMKLVPVDYDPFAEKAEPVQAPRVGIQEPRKGGITEGLKQIPRGFVHGSLGIAESAGTGLEYIGHRMQEAPGLEDLARTHPGRAYAMMSPTDQKTVSDLINKGADFQDALIEVTTNPPYVPMRESMKKAAPGVIQLGKDIAGSQAEVAEQYGPPEQFAEKNVWDNPEVLKSPTWWLYNTAEMAPTLAAAMIPGAGTYKAVQVGGAALKLSPVVISRMAQLGAMVTGGAVGGTLEGTQTYKAVLEAGGTEQEAARAMELMGLFSAGLNSISVGKMFTKAGPGFLNKVKKVGASGIVEGLTEGAEEPSEVIAKIGAKLFTGQKVPDNIAQMFFDSLKDAVTVAPIAAVTGFAGGAGGAQVAGAEAKDMLQGDAEPALVNEINQILPEEEPVAPEPAAPKLIPLSQQRQAEIERIWAEEEAVEEPARHGIVAPEDREAIAAKRRQEEIDRFAEEQARTERIQQEYFARPARYGIALPEERRQPAQPEKPPEEIATPPIPKVTPEEEVALEAAKKPQTETEAPWLKTLYRGWTEGVTKERGEETSWSPEKEYAQTYGKKLSTAKLSPKAKVLSFLRREPDLPGNPWVTDYGSELYNRYRKPGPLMNPPYMELDFDQMREDGYDAVVWVDDGIEVRVLTGDALEKPPATPERTEVAPEGVEGEEPRESPAIEARRKELEGLPRPDWRTHLFRAREYASVLGVTWDPSWTPEQIADAVDSHLDKEGLPEEAAPEPEYIAGMALKMDDGRIITGEDVGVEGVSHTEIWDKLSLEDRDRVEDADGVVTNTGRFLTREEAAEFVGKPGELLDASELVSRRKGAEKPAAAPEEAPKKPEDMTAGQWFDYKWSKLPKKVQRAILSGEKGYASLQQIREQTHREHERLVEQPPSAPKKAEDMTADELLAELDRQTEEAPAAKESAEKPPAADKDWIGNNLEGDPVYEDERGRYLRKRAGTGHAIIHAPRAIGPAGERIAPKTARQLYKESPFSNYITEAEYKRFEAEKNPAEKPPPAPKPEPTLKAYGVEDVSPLAAELERALTREPKIPRQLAEEAGIPYESFNEIRAVNEAVSELALHKIASEKDGKYIHGGRRLVRPKATLAEKATETKQHLANAADKFKQINAILGEKGELAPGEEIDETKWAQIQPLLKGAWDDIIAAGKTGAEFVSLALEALGTKGKPYIARFIREVKAPTAPKSLTKPPKETIIEPTEQPTEGGEYGPGIEQVVEGPAGIPPGVRAGDRPAPVPEQGEVPPAPGREGEPRDQREQLPQEPGPEPGPEGRDRDERDRPDRGAAVGEPTPGGARVPDTGVGGAANHVILPDDVIVPRGPEGKIKANIRAIQLVKTLQQENRAATPDEKKILAQYVGWGAFSQKIFDPEFTDYIAHGKDRYTPEQWFTSPEQAKKYREWETRYGEKLHPGLGGAMTEEEWKSARASTINAHFTSRPVINAMWDIAERMGFKGGTVLEPAAGVGHFFGLMPQRLAQDSVLFGIEKDTLSGAILDKLYPDANTQTTPFEKSNIENNSMDMVITNVPFGNVSIIDKKHPEYSGWSLHNYFFARSLTATKPGGLVMAITSSWTMDAKSNARVREYLAGKADLVGAVRLPNTAFKESAGTEVVTDIIVLRKKDNSEYPGHDFLTSTTLDTPEKTEAEASLQEAIQQRDVLQKIPAKKRTDSEKKQLSDAKEDVSKSLKKIAGLYGVNEYFTENPKMVLGKHSMKGTMYAEGTYTLEPTGNLHDQIEAIITEFPENIAGEGTDVSEVEPVVYAELGAKEGTLTVKDGVVQLVENGKLIKPYYLDSKGNKQPISGLRLKRVERYLQVREATVELFDLMADVETTDQQVTDGQKRLEKLYDGYVKKYGYFNSTANGFIRQADNDFAVVDALEIEDDDDKNVYHKAPVFTKRTIFPFVEPTTAESVEDAAYLSMAYRGTIDVKYIGSLLNIQDLEAVKTDLVGKGLAFIEPDTGLMIQKDEYLSGNVKKKLKAAQAAAQDDDLYKTNVDALQAVVPEDMDISLIDFKLGSSWIPADTIKDFLREVIEVEADIEFAQGETGAIWKIAEKSGFNGIKNRETYGTQEYYATGLIENALNMRRIKIKRKERDPVTGSERTYEDKDASKENNLKIQEISSEFVAWAKSHGEWAARLQDIYNEEKNGFVLRTHSPPVFRDAEGKETVHYPNASAEITLREHQRIAVSRALQESVLLAYGVGTGKTYIYITTAMEMRRIGTARKPLIVVHNQTIDQYRTSFKTLYPAAKVLIPNYAQRSSKMRKKTLVSMATGDWDAIVLPQSFFDGIANDPDRERAFVEEQLMAIEEQIASTREEEGSKSLRVKEMEKMLQRREQRLEALLERRKDEAVLFEQMGIDALLIDEVHAYKRSEFYTKLGNVKGIDSGSSQRSSSLILKSEYVRRKTGGKNVITATGTPISNTMAELWTMLRYVRPDLLEEYGVSTFDNFANTFGDIVEDVEETASGFKDIERFARYVNGPELLMMFFSGADIRLTKDANLKLPAIKGGKPEIVVSEKSEELRRYIQGIVDRWRAWEALNGREKRKQRHVPLVLYGLAKKAAVDLRLIDPAYYKEDPDSKLGNACENIHRIYQETKAKKSTQIVFLDIFQDETRRFNAHQEIKRKLTELGIPEAEIELFSSGINEKKEKAIKDRIRSGESRVIIGSSARLGIGVDIANKLIASHHINVPDRPMDIEQRDGRIIRQGNENDEVQIYHYCTKDTLDSVMFNRLVKKQKYADQVLTGDIEGRTFEDPYSTEQASFAEFAAAASGQAGKLLLEKNSLLSEQNKYKIAQNAWTRRVSSARSKLREIPVEIANMRKRLKEVENEKKKIEKAFPDLQLETLTFEGETMDRKVFAERLADTIKGIDEEWKSKYHEMASGDFAKEIEAHGAYGQVERTITAKAGNIDISLKLSTFTDYKKESKPSKKIHYFGLSKWVGVNLSLDGHLLDSSHPQTESLPGGTFTRLFNDVIKKAVALPKGIEQDIAREQEDEKEFEKIADEKFQYREQLVAAQRRIAEIDRELVNLTKDEEPAEAPEEPLRGTPEDFAVEAQAPKRRFYRSVWLQGKTRWTEAPSSAEPIEIVPWAETYIYGDENGWHVVEVTSGQAFGPWQDTRQEAIDAAKEIVEQKGEEGVKKAIADSIQKTGPAPAVKAAVSKLTEERGSISFKSIQDALTSEESETDLTVVRSHDMGRLEKLEAPPQWLAKKYDEVKQMFERMKQRDRDRIRMLSQSIDESAEFYGLKKDSEEFSQLKHLIWAMENRAMKGMPRKFVKVGGEEVEAEGEAWERGAERNFAFDPDSTKNEGRFQLLPPGQVSDYFNRYSSTEGVRYVMGKTEAGAEVVQSVRFKKELFTEDKAGKWWEKNAESEGLGFAEAEIIGGHYELNEDYYTQYREWLGKLKSVSEPVKDIYLQIRKSLDKDLSQVYNSMADMPDIEESVLQEFRRSMGTIHNYFPHMRYGKYFLQAFNEDGELVFREHFNAPTGYERKARRLIAELKKQEGFAGVSFKTGKVERLPEEVFAIPVPIEAIEAVMNAAIKRIPNEDARSAFKAMLPENIANVLKARGWGAHMIRRQGIPGHETEDIQRVLFDYKAGLYGWMTKMECARDFSRIMARVDPAGKARLWAWMRNYSYNMLENASEIDRLVSNAKALFFAKYLGANVKTAVLNTTQNIIAGWPRLGMEMGGAFAQALKGANADIVSHIRGQKNLSADEVRLIQQMFEEGTTGAQFLTEIRSQIGDNVFSATNKYLMRGLGMPMEIAERFNRVSIAIAAYRAAVDGKINNESTLKQYDVKQGEALSYDQAKEFATTIVEDAHFVYGRSNRPEAFRVGEAGKLAQAGYTFRSFTHHLLHLWKYMLLETGMRGKTAFAKSLAATMAIGGVTAIPLYKTFMNILRQLTGDDPEEDITAILPEDADMLKDMLLYGMPAISGFTIGGSVGMELPVFERLSLQGSITTQAGKQIGEIIGIPWAVAEDVSSAYQAYRVGQGSRALEYLLPAGIANIFKGYRLYSAGNYTLSGRPIADPSAQDYPQTEEVLKLGMRQAIGKAFGFQPTKMTGAWNIEQAMQDFIAYKTNKRSELASRILNAKGIKRKLKKIEQDYIEWNQKHRVDHPEYVITPDELVQSILARTRTRKPPMYMLGRTLELRDRYLTQEAP